MAGDDKVEITQRVSTIKCVVNLRSLGKRNSKTYIMNGGGENDCHFYRCSSLSLLVADRTVFGRFSLYVVGLRR